MPESMDERERFTLNPLRLMRCAVEMGRGALTEAMKRVDDSIVTDYGRIDIDEVEAPVATEEELLQMRLF